MPLLDIDGATINFETLGDKGEWITLINGHTRSGSDFRMMARILTESREFRVLMIDNRGSGKSQVTKPFTMIDMCDDIVRVWDHLGVSASNVLGISMGGFISQGLAIKYPQRVNKLVLVSTAPEESYIHPTGGAWSVEGDLVEQKMHAYFAPGFVDRNPVLFKTMISQIKIAITSGRFAKLSDLQRDAMRGASWLAQLGKISAKTMIIHGEMDRVVDLAGAEILREKIPNSTLEVIPGAGHLLLAENPKALYRLASEFFLGR